MSVWWLTLQVIIVHYIFAVRGNLHVPSLYDGSKSGLYRYWSGVNWLAVFAWCGGAIMGIPGLVGQYSPELVSEAAMNMYQMGTSQVVCLRSS